MNELTSTQTEATTLLEEFRSLGPDEATLVEFFRANTQGNLIGSKLPKYTRPEHGIVCRVSGEARAEGISEEKHWISLIKDSTVQNLEIRFADSELGLGGNVGRRICLAVGHFQTGEAIVYNIPTADRFLLNSPFGKWAVSKIAGLIEAYPPVV